MSLFLGKLYQKIKWPKNREPLATISKILVDGKRIAGIWFYRSSFAILIIFYILDGLSFSNAIGYDEAENKQKRSLRIHVNLNLTSKAAEQNTIFFLFIPVFIQLPFDDKFQM